MKSVDKFGHYRGFQGKAGPPGLGFNFNKEGDFDLSNKRLTNVKDPQKDHDVVTKNYLKGMMDINTILMDKNKKTWMCKHKKLSDVENPENGGDVVNLSFLKDNTLNCVVDGHAFNAVKKKS